MNSYQIEKFLNNNIDVISAVLGADEMPKTLNTRPIGFIINNKPSCDAGEHWLAFYFPLNSIPEYFDSLGRPPEFYNINFLQFLLKENSSFKYNTNRIQNFSSNLCGQYCLFFLLFRSKGIDYETIMQCFSPDLEANDKYVQNMIG